MRTPLLVLAVTVALTLIGCGGGGGGSTTSPFAGTYSGTWVEASEVGPNVGDGTIDLAVDDKGNWSGTFVQQNPTGRSGDLSGRIRRDGTYDFTVHFPENSVSYVGEGRIETGRLIGSFSEQGIGYGGFFPYMELTKQ